MLAAKGAKPQKTDAVDVAALQMERKFGLNNEIIYDRVRFVMHLHGMRWWEASRAGVEGGTVSQPFC